MFANKLAEMTTIKEVLTSAESLAHEMGDKEPGSEHLLLAAIDMQDGLARRAFEQVGARPRRLRDRDRATARGSTRRGRHRGCHPSRRRTSPPATGRR